MTDAEPAADGQLPGASSSVPLDPALAAASAYLLGFVTGFLVLLFERRNSFVRFHALQSILTSLGAAVWVGCAILLGLPRVPFIGFAIYLVCVPGILVLWLLLMVKAYKGERYQLPLFGSLAARLIGGRTLAPPPAAS